MRVILVNKFHYRKGGSETYYFGVAEALREMGHEVHFFAMEDEKNLPCEDSDLFVPNRDYNGPSSPVAKVSAAVSIVYSGEAKRRFEILCERVHPDIVHMNLVHRQITLSILDAPYLKRHDVPVVWTAHDYIAVCPSYTMLDGAGEICEACVGGRFFNCFKRKCVKGSSAKSGMATLEAEYLKCTNAYRKIDRIICPSQFLGSKMVEGGFSANQLSWMPNFIPELTVEEIAKASALDDGTPYFLFFGRLSHEKGVDVLLRAFAQAAGDGGISPDWRLKIAGEGPMHPALESLAFHCGVMDRVEFLGHKSGDELRSLVKGARFSVAPSTWFENMPFSIVESLAAGTPVLGSRMGGIPELVTDGRTGYTFTSGDVGELADLLCSTAQQPDAAYRQMQRAGQSFVKERCAQAAYMNKLIDLYISLIKEKKGN